MFEEILKGLAEAFARAGVPYMVFGGQAVLLYGEPRLTRDVDVSLGADPTEPAPVLAVIEELGLQSLVGDAAEFLRETFVLPVVHPESGIRIDLVFSLSGYERQAIERAKTVSIGGVGVRFASLEDLIVQKVVAGRPRDLDDAEKVIAKNPGFDRAYVERWLQEFGQELDTQFLLVFQRILGGPS